MGTSVTLVRQYGNPTFNSLIVEGPTNLSGSFFNSGSITTANNLIVSGNSTFISSITASGDITTTGNQFINNSSPTIYLRDTDHRSSMIHCNSNIFYVLRGSGNNSITWAQFNGYWPLEINLENNNATFGGNVTAAGNVTAFSDARVKTNIKTIDNALSKVLALRGVTYNRTDLEDKSEQIGIIAQEIKEILPQVVQENEGHYSVAYGNIVGVLIEAIKEQQTQIEELKSRL